MRVGIPLETAAGETRVAATPETAKKLKAQGHEVRVQAGAGLAASVTDEAYAAAGADITDRAGAFGSELVLKVRPPSPDELGAMGARHRARGHAQPVRPRRPGAPGRRGPHELRARGRAAHDARAEHGRAVESLGAKFIDLPYETAEEKEAAEGVGGYARPMPPSWLERQKAEVAKRVAQADIVISTALIPGRPAPVLVTEEMVRSMKPGSVIVDLAAPNGGNCPLTEPGKTVVRHGVTIVGETNLPALVAADSSALYARNVLDFLKLVLTKEGTFEMPADDDIVAACLMTHGNEVKRS